MRLSSLLVVLPLAFALPQAPAVEVRAVEARGDSCSETRDSCLNGCRPTGLGYIYCVSNCFAAAKWCEVAENDDD
ncbi:hypothetical protein TARUN_2875 [Trichoderma arundinaceum]|uniref:Uncharacterized protein n=1 Tax=Trichoderma arundinaceum TaxID=490622 RepID=A0A395NTF8_TRIAR|nr:hypothetical protein TARUN_2875 [Trichoderma arundinaceum]